MPYLSALEVSSSNSRSIKRWHIDTITRPVLHVWRSFYHKLFINRVYNVLTRLGILLSFRRPFVKRFALCYRTVVLPVCDVGALWPNSWLDQDETWHGCRPRPRPHSVRWGPSSPLKGGGGTAAPPFWPMSIVAKRSPISATAEHFLLFKWLPLT